MSCGKVVYRRRIDAKIALFRAQSKGTSKRNERRIYWCQTCHGFHLTSKQSWKAKYPGPRSGWA